MYSSILVPVDGSEFSEKAVREASRLAQTLGSTVVLFHAVPPHYQLPPLEREQVGADSKRDKQKEKLLAQQELESEARDVLLQAAKKASLANGKLEQQFAISDSPYEAIINAAMKAKCDLIVMASHGRRGTSAILLGSETQKVLTHSLIPVLVVR